MSAWAPLSGTRVVEACQRLVGPFAGWHLAMLGARVAKVEPPPGDIARSWAGGHMFDVINGQKLCAALDIDNPVERTAFEKLCAGADIVIADASWSEQPALAGSRHDDARTRSVVIVDDGPVPGGSGSSETLAQAAMAVTGYIGEPGGRPLRLGADLASVSAAATAVQAALAGLLRDDGQGPLLSRISIDRATATLKTIHWAARSDPDRWLGYHLTAIARQPDRGYRVRDGWVTLDFLPAQGAAWRALCAELGLAKFVDEVGEDWFSTIGMEDRVDWARPHYERAFAGYTRDEAITLIRKHGGWSVPFQEPAEALHHPQSQLYASAFFEGGEATVRLPWRVDNQPQGRHRPAAAPPIGAHTNEVLALVSKVGPS
jgi:crotonobetainyl-CoA:carnitine CoA-transferase CaiB-like acyl-CoA transferase